MPSKSRNLGPLALTVMAVVALLQESPFTAPQYSGPPRFTVTELELPSFSAAASAFDINERGDIVGMAELPGARGWFGVRWTPAVESLEMLPAGTYCWAWSINEAGAVSGGCEIDGSSVAAPVMWPKTSPVLLDSIGTFAIGAALNNRGEVVGYAHDGGVNFPVKWTRQGLSYLETLGGSQTAAAAINGTGQVAGWASLPNASLVQAAKWDRGGNLQLLDAAFSLAYAINKWGDVVGSRTIDGAPVARMWPHTAGGGRDLTSQYSEAYDINDAGWSVGFVDDPLGHSTAFFHDGNALYQLRTLIDGPNPFSQLLEARGINNRGQIVGLASRDGKSRAFLLTPITGR